MNECRRCTRPTDRFTCETCADELSIALGNVPAMVEELDTSITGQRGIDYRRGRSNAHDAPTKPEKGDRPDLGVHVQPLLGNGRASGAQTNLRATLMAWCVFCLDRDVRNSSPIEGLPDQSIEGMSRFLLWRVDGLTLVEEGSAAVEQITKAVERAERVIDRPADKWFAGPCDECGVDMYANPTAAAVVCPACNLEYDVAERRAWLLEEARNYQATAVEIARAVTVLGDYTGKSGVRGLVSRLDKWRDRSRITVRGHKFVDGKNRPMYRVGDVLDLLADDMAETGREG